MNIKKKILAITIVPVLVLGLISLAVSTTMVKNSMLDEIQDALKGTAAATLAAYDQNTGDYLETTSGDIWKGSYNVSKSENLVDRIKSNSGMDVTFFYGDKRIMTSAVDEQGNRIRVCAPNWRRPRRDGGRRALVPYRQADESP